MNDLQKKLLKMLKWFHEYCSANSLRYYIIEGTVIGACRHKGFIPWDDDIDIGMPRADYNRLMKLFSKRIDDYVLETPYSKNEKYICPWCKIFDVTTTKIEKSKYEAKLGIYIDIFPLDGLGNKYDESVAQFKKIDFLNMLWATRICSIRKGRGFIKNAAIIISRMIPQFIINDKKLVIQIDKQCRKFDFDKCEYVACTLSTYRQKEIMKRSVYGMPSEYSFEGITVYGPEQYEEYLSKIYGDWRTLPPKEKRVNVHDYVYLNLNESYLGK